MINDKTNNASTTTIPQSSSQDYPHTEVINEGKTPGRPSPKEK